MLNPHFSTSELTLAENIQRSLLPKPFVREDIELDVRYHPAAILGGDYAAARWMDSHRLCLAMCDVCGHGVAATILANRVNSEVRHLMKSAPEPWALVDRLNRFIHQNYAYTHMFLTFTCLQLDLKTQTLLHAGAGHPPVLIVSADGGRTEWIPSRNKLIGYYKDCLHKHQQSEVALKSGDVLVLFTDGLTESMNARKKLFGEERLRQAVAAARTKPATGIADNLLAEANAWRSGQPQEDDILVLVAKINQLPSQAGKDVRPDAAADSLGADTLILPPEAEPNPRSLLGMPGARASTGTALEQDYVTRAGAPHYLDGCLEFVRDGSTRLKICDGAGSCRLIQLALPVEDLSSEKVLAHLPRVGVDGWKTPVISQIPLLAKLGEGARASVYYGIHPRLGRAVAANVLAPWVLEKHPGMVYRFNHDPVIRMRLNACVFKGAVRYGSEWVVVPMCSMNESAWEALFASRIRQSRDGKQIRGDA